MASNWEPLSDIWNHLAAETEAAAEDGRLTDPEVAEAVTWPPDLYIGELEKDDVREFIGERMNELISHMMQYQMLDPNMIAAYIFRALMCGMKWEKERIGA